MVYNVKIQPANIGFLKRGLETLVTNPDGEIVFKGSAINPERALAQLTNYLVLHAWDRIIPANETIEVETLDTKALDLLGKDLYLLFLDFQSIYNSRSSRI